jgi:hypothetical protein
MHAAVSSPGVALVVAFDRAVRSAVAGWLEAAGLDVEVCPGPLTPTYRCVASEPQGCALARDAAVVVLDLWLQSDADDAGASAFDLVRYYRSLRLPMIVLDHERPISSLFAAHGVAVVSWPPNRAELVRFAIALARRGTRSARPYPRRLSVANAARLRPSESRPKARR